MASDATSRRVSLRTTKTKPGKKNIHQNELPKEMKYDRKLTLEDELGPSVTLSVGQIRIGFAFFAFAKWFGRLWV